MLPVFARIAAVPAKRAAGLILLAGCLSQHPEQLTIEPISHLTSNDAATCLADSLSDLEGQHFSVLAERNLIGDLRILYPDQGVTSETVPTRLDVQVDQSGTIRNLFCG